MLTKVIIDNFQGPTLSLPLQDITSGYVVKEIDGLDPVKATITSSPFAQLDGSTYQAARRENRNIILKLGIKPDYGSQTVQQLRQALYAYFIPKTQIILQFYNDDVFFASIIGRVESCDATPFAQDPEIVVSVICFDPNFVAAGTVTVNGNTVATGTEQTITYPGTIETGYIFTLSVNRSVSAFSIYNRRPNGDVRQMDVALSLVAGDVVIISTQVKNKYATLTRGGVTTSILYAVTAISNWGPLNPGNNYYRVLATGAAIPFTVVYTTKYGGL